MMGGEADWTRGGLASRCGDLRTTMDEISSKESVSPRFHIVQAWRNTHLDVSGPHQSRNRRPSSASCSETQTLCNMQLLRWQRRYYIS